MSGNTEFQRAVNRFNAHKTKALRWLRRYMLPLLRLRVIRGVIIGAHHGPLRGAKITLNGWRTLQSDDRGRFNFRFVFRPVSSLTVEWREAELVNWIEVDATHQRVSNLKLKWPALVRGQVIDRQGVPMTQVPVALNRSQITKTDAHGTFIFPLEEEKTESSDQLVFQLGEYSFVHHFKANPQAHLLHRFMLSEAEGLYHIEDRASAQAMSKSVSILAERLRRCFWVGISIIIIYLMINMVVTQRYNDHTPQLISDQHASQLNRMTDSENKGATSPWSSAGLLERAPDHDLKEENSSADKQRPPLWDQGDEGSSAEVSVLDIPIDGSGESSALLDDEDQPQCSAMEFTYLRYYVPRGMEGILLSLVFGHWQSWRDDLSLFNGYDRHHELQAGQRLKIKLPLHRWSRYQHQGEESWRKLLALGQCELDEKMCMQLLQAWNPHVSIKRLRKRNQLLINLSLLKNRPFEGATRTRVEGLRRGGVPRRQRPRLKLPSACSLPLLFELDEK